VSTEELARGGSGGEFVDPRAWAKETTSQPNFEGRRPNGSVPLDGPLASLFDESRPTLRDDGAISAQAAVALQAVGPAGRRTPPSIPDALAGPTPGPEALASVLEPTPSPRTRAGTKTMAKAAAPTAVRQNKLLIGMLIGLAVLAVAVTAPVLAKRQSVKRAASHAASTGSRRAPPVPKAGEPAVSPVARAGQPQLEMLAPPKHVQALQQPVRARPSPPKVPRPRARPRAKAADDSAASGEEAEGAPTGDDSAPEASEAPEGQ
jgi:hypothetical protein